MRVAVLDIGSNSTRLLIAEVDASGGSIVELVRHSRVTRLGDGVDAAGRLSEEAIGRVLGGARGVPRGDRLPSVRGEHRGAHLGRREAANGEEFAARVREDYDLDARVLSGDEEARLTFLGAMSGRQATSEPTVVIDIGGGSTEFIVGHDHTAGFHVSVPVGVVRMSERHIHTDPRARRSCRASPSTPARLFSPACPSRSGLPCARGSQSPARPPRRRRSTRSSTPTTPSG